MEAEGGLDGSRPLAVTRERTRLLREQAAARLSAALEMLDQQARELAELRTKVANLEQALQTNRRIGQAIGIIMARNLITEDEAFRLLRETSQRSHRKLREVADAVVETGEVPTAAA
jgi:AmiR/NasT family two-component response regulator